MNNLYKYYYYDKDQDKVIRCSWDEYHKEVASKVDLKFWGENFNTVKHDQFENAYRLALLDIEYVDPIDEDDWRNEPEKKILSGVDAGY